MRDEGGDMREEDTIFLDEIEAQVISIFVENKIFDDEMIAKKLLELVRKIQDKPIQFN